MLKGFSYSYRSVAAHACRGIFLPAFLSAAISLAPHVCFALTPVPTPSATATYVASPAPTAMPSPTAMYSPSPTPMPDYTADWPDTDYDTPSDSEASATPTPIVSELSGEFMRTGSSGEAMSCSYYYIETCSN